MTKPCACWKRMLPISRAWWWGGPLLDVGASSSEEAAMMEYIQKRAQSKGRNGCEVSLLGNRIFQGCRCSSLNVASRGYDSLQRRRLGGLALSERILATEGEQVSSKVNELRRLARSGRCCDVVRGACSKSSSSLKAGKEEHCAELFHQVSRASLPRWSVRFRKVVN